MNDENMRLKEWQSLMEDYNEFFYADDGIFTSSLFDKELEKLDRKKVNYLNPVRMK